MTNVMAKAEPKTSIILPAYDEAAVIAAVVPGIQKAMARDGAGRNQSSHSALLNSLDAVSAENPDG